MKVAIIGNGKLGSGLSALANAVDVEATLIGRDWPKRLDALRHADIIVLAVPDDNISLLFNQLTPHLIDFSGTVIHCAGSLDSGVLNNAIIPIKRVASAHPVFAFSSPEITLEHFAGSYVVVEGDLEAAQVANELFTRLGGVILSVNSLDKAKYHCATVMSSNLVVALLDMATKQANEAGISNDDALRLLTNLAIRNIESVAKLGTNKALTGPASRGDIHTIERHLSGLLNSVESDTYQSLSQHAVDMSDHLASNVKARLKDALK